jgi:hypothetical protein
MKITHVIRGAVSFCLKTPPPAANLN